MATGLLIRDFVKEYRELRYSNSGSISLSDIEHNAYRAALTLEITHIDAPRYGSLKTLPENTHYGYVTLFRGSTVIDAIAIKYPKFRVFDIRNQGIWNYHQLTENQQLGASTVQLSVNAASRSLWEVLGDGIGNLTEFVIGAYYRSVGEETPGWVLQAFDEDEGVEEPFGNEFERYRGFPIATPFPDIAKFKSDVPVSFLWRLELWYLVNPVVYIVDNPTDVGDETEGEEEYPEPENGDGDGDGSEFPVPSPIPSDRDPRDYDSANTPPSPPPFSGGQCEGVSYRVFAVAKLFNGVTCFTFPETEYGVVVGPVSGFRVEPVDVSPGSPPSNLWFVDHAGGSLSLGLVSEFNCPGAGYSGLRLVRVDGLPDDCGDPPPMPS